MDKYQVIEALARERAVETMVENIAHSSLTPDLKDLSQMFYVILLEYDEEKILDLWRNSQMQFFLARIITNQVKSTTSPFHYIYRKWQERHTDIRPCDRDRNEKKKRNDNKRKSL